MTEEKVTGFLHVGINENSEVVVNLPKDMTGHIVFSPNQARDFARVLLKQADSAEGKEVQNESMARRH